VVFEFTTKANVCSAGEQVDISEMIKCDTLNNATSGWEYHLYFGKDCIDDQSVAIGQGSSDCVRVDFHGAYAMVECSAAATFIVPSSSALALGVPIMLGIVLVAWG
jgi:hypothetical protein